MNRDYESLLSAGNQAQREKLEENMHKKGWDCEDLRHMFRLLLLEEKELEEEMICLNHGLNNYDTIRREAADIANFAHMIILACDRKLNTDLVTVKKLEE